MTAFDWSSTLNSALPAILGAGGVGGVWAFINKRAELHAAKETDRARLDADAAKTAAASPANMLGAMAAFQDALNVQARELTADLRVELGVQGRKLERAEARIETLETENEQCRVENMQIKGELRDVRQRAESLEEMLRRQGVDMPARSIPGSFITFQGDKVTALTPAPEDPSR